MSTWTKARIEQMIADGIEEGPALDYKAAGALFKSDEKRREITRDVSAFANASGGTIIYGVAEFSDSTRKHLPEKVDPISRTLFSREWLEHVIQGIEPKIENLKIHSVAIDEGQNLVCYVVEIPESDTAHQATDGRYYKRYNFERQVMRDRDIRDVMSRRKHPKLSVSIRVNMPVVRQSGGVLVKLENVGNVMPAKVMAHIELPLRIAAASSDGSHSLGSRDGHHFVDVRLVPKLMTPPLFPGSTLILKGDYDGGFIEGDNPLSPWTSVKDISIRVYADEMPRIEGTVLLETALKQWVKVC